MTFLNLGHVILHVTEHESEAVLIQRGRFDEDR